MGEEVDKIYVQLKGYESEIKQSNKKLDTMFKTNVDYYHELVKYILAGEQACKEIEAYIAQRQQDMENTGDQSIQFELTSLNQALMMLEQRTQDLRTAENVAMQSIPMIKTMEFSNYNLVRKDQILRLSLRFLYLSRHLRRQILLKKAEDTGRNLLQNWIRKTK